VVVGLALCVLAAIAFGPKAGVKLLALGLVVCAILDIEVALIFTALSFSYAIPLFLSPYGAAASPRLEDFVFVILAGSYLVLCLSRGRLLVRSTPPLAPLLAWVGLAAVSTACSAAFGESVRGAMFGVLGLAHFLQYVATYVIVTAMIQTFAQARRMLLALWAGSLWVMGFSVWAHLTNYLRPVPGWGDWYITASTSTLSGHRGHLGMYSLMMLFLIPALISTERCRWLQVALALSLPLEFWGLIASAARIVWLAFPACCLVLVLLRPRALVPVAVASAIGGIAAVSLWNLGAVPPQVMQQVEESFLPGSRPQYSALSRLQVWESNIARTTETPTGPVLGIGFMQYAYRGTAGVYGWGVRPGSPTHWSSHNNFLHVWSELGLPGLAVFLWFLKSIIAEPLRVARRRRDRRADIALAYLCGTTGVLITTVVQEPLGITVGFMSFFYFFLFLTGVVMRVIRLPGKEPAVGITGSTRDAVCAPAA
jgi:O-antigen ligase